MPETPSVAGLKAVGYQSCYLAMYESPARIAKLELEPIILKVLEKEIPWAFVS